MSMNTHAGSNSHTVEGIARVVRVEGAVAWLEPEQTTSCQGCASASSCGTPGIGTVASRMEVRRFALDNPGNLAVGERVVVGVADRALIKGALIAYALPLATALAAGGIAESEFGSDLVSMAAMAAGLGLGLLAAHLGARRLARQGELAPHFLRRARPGETCHPG
jgi:sigma-E factor negative regulatory protein RseC